VAQADEALDEELAQAFAKEMASFMNELGRAESDAAATSATADDDATDGERRRAMMAAWEAMLVEGMDGAAQEREGQAAGPGAGAEEDAFQKTIREAMSKMKRSEQTLQADADAEAQAPDSIEALLAQLGGGEGDEAEDFQHVLESMMTQLMSREVLYEPLKELNDKVRACHPFSLFVSCSRTFHSSPATSKTTPRSFPPPTRRGTRSRLRACGRSSRSSRIRRTRTTTQTRAPRSCT
jgi:hypothetical protein